MSTEKKQFPRAGETISMEMYIHQDKYTSILLPFNCDMSSNGYPCFGKTIITFTMPDGDALKAMVAALEADLQKEMADSHVRCTAIKEKIQQLLAIGHDGGES